MKRRVLGGLALLVMVLVVALPMGARAQFGDLLETLLKVGGVGLIVDTYGEKIDHLLNEVLDNRGIPREEATKVVPILSLGRGGYIGLAQVGGPKEKVEQVEAVVQLEAELIGNKLRAKVLVPVDSKDITHPKDINKVRGVGVSAIIDLKL